VKRRSLHRRYGHACRPEIVFHYRGEIERGSARGYKWHEGWSRNSPNGGIEYPWLTRREAQRYAISLGGKAVFAKRKS
jgi:hypothetical protein